MKAVTMPHGRVELLSCLSSRRFRAVFRGIDKEVFTASIAIMLLPHPSYPEV